MSKDHDNGYNSVACYKNCLNIWCLTPFSTVCHLYRGGQRTYPCFPSVLLTSTPHNILSKSVAAFPHNYCQNNDSGERGMNPVAMTMSSSPARNRLSNEAGRLL